MEIKDRVRQKQSSRDGDLRRLRAGEVTVEEFKIENGFCSSLNLRQFRIPKIGNKELKKC